MTSTTARLHVTAPPAAGSHGYPFGLSLVDLAAHGYRADEWFLEGDATRYRPAASTELGVDGRWTAEPAGTRPYRTRVLVYRPVDPDRFNGTVVLHWNNVSAGYELFSGDTPELLEGGYAFAGVTTQRVGVHGLPTAPQGLQAWDPERYGTLSIASDDDSFDIFTQAARAVGPDRDRTTDPLGGLDVQRVIAMGSSQSAGRLGAYVNAIHPLAHAIDAYLLADLLRQRLTARGRRRGRQHRQPGGPLRCPRRAPRAQPDPRRPRRPGDGRQLGARSDRLLPGAPARHRPLPLLGVGGHVPRLAAGDGPAGAEVRARLRHAAAAAGIRQPHLDDPALRRRAAPRPQVADDGRGAAASSRASSSPATRPRSSVTSTASRAAASGSRRPTCRSPRTARSRSPTTSSACCTARACRSHPTRSAALYGDLAKYLARFEEAARAAEKAGVLLPRDVTALVDEARAAYPDAAR